MVSIWYGCLLLGFSFLVWRGRLRGLRDTTLVAPWFWTWLSFASVTLVEIGVSLGGMTSAPWVQPLRFAVASSLFCPAISLLGVKRPQDRAWNFVVVTLWGVLALPALEVALLGRGEDLQLQDVRAWFLWVLIGLEASQRLGTKYWPASVLWAAAEILLLSRYLPLLRWELPPPVRDVALSLMFVAMAYQLASLPPRIRSWDRLWLDFRDLFGVAWSLRVMERVNAAAERYEWPWRLRWTGFAEPIGVGPGSLETCESDMTARLEPTVRNLLRRFVSDEWISQRLPERGSDRLPLPAPRCAPPSPSDDITKTA